MWYPTAVYRNHSWYRLLARCCSCSSVSAACLCRLSCLSLPRNCCFLFCVIFVKLLCFNRLHFPQLQNSLKWSTSFTDYRAVFIFPTVAERLMLYLSFVDYRAVFTHLGMLRMLWERLSRPYSAACYNDVRSRTRLTRLVNANAAPR